MTQDMIADLTKLNAGQLVQRIMRVMDHANSGQSCEELAEQIAAGILDLPPDYWRKPAPSVAPPTQDRMREALEHIKRMHDDCCRKSQDIRTGLKNSQMSWEHYNDQAIGLSHAIDVLHNAMAAAPPQMREALEEAVVALTVFNGHDSNANLISEYGKEWWTGIRAVLAKAREALSSPPQAAARTENETDNRSVVRQGQQVTVSGEARPGDAQGTLQGCHPATPRYLAPQAADIKSVRLDAWGKYDAQRPRGDVSAKPAFDAGFDAGFVCAIMYKKKEPPQAAVSSGVDGAMRSKLIEWRDRFLGYKADGTNWNYSDLIKAVDEMNAMLAAAPPPPEIGEDAISKAICCPLGCQFNSRERQEACKEARSHHVSATRAILALISKRSGQP